MKDAVYHAIQKEYNSRLLAVQRDEERVNELQAQLGSRRQDIVFNKVVIAQLEAYAIEHGWNIKDLVKS